MIGSVTLRPAAAVWQASSARCGPGRGAGTPGLLQAPWDPCSHSAFSLQMDHTAFPCGCCREGCENPKGRVEFNQARVQTHFLHTLTRLQLEQGAESLGELEAPAPGSPASPAEQALAPAFPLAKPPVSSELGENSCSSDMTDSSTASGTSEAPSSATHPALPVPGFQPDVDDDSLARVLSLSDSDLGGEEEEEEEGGGGGPRQPQLFPPR